MSDELGEEKPTTVLLLCSNSATLTNLTEILTQAGTRPIVAADVRQAWHQIKTGSIGCVVVEVSGAGLTELALFRAARSSLRCWEAPFLFLIPESVVPVPLERAGADLTRDAWLKMPCSAQNLLAYLRALLEHRGESGTFGLNESEGLDKILDLSNGVFAGRLGLMEVTRIVSMVEALKSTGLLTVGDGQRTGTIYFDQGAVRHAVLNEIEGPDALFLLFHLKQGNFRFDLGVPTTQRTIEGNTMTLLLEGLRQMDEAKELIKHFRQSRAVRESGGAAAEQRKG